MLRPLVAILLFIGFPGIAGAWTAATHQRIAEKSAQLAPPDMRLLISGFERDFLRGLTYWDSDPASEVRHGYVVAERRGDLRRLIESETAEAIRIMRAGGPVADFVERLGRIAHLVSDANNPFHVATDPARLMASRNDFEAYMERSMARFPTVFYGLEFPVDIRRYIDGALVRTASYYPLLDEEYFRGGTRRSSSSFDDRSTGFGVASLAYSHSVTDIVHVYYHVWHQVGGDVRSAAAMRKSNLLRNE